MHMHLAIVVAIVIGLFCLLAIAVFLWGNFWLKKHYRSEYEKITNLVNEAEAKVRTERTLPVYELELRPARFLWVWLLPKIFMISFILSFAIMFIPLIWHMPGITLHDITSADAGSLFTFFCSIILCIICAVYVCLWVAKALWLVSGNELITIDATTLTRQRRIAGISFRNNYELKNISGPSVAIMEDSNTSLFFRGNYQAISYYYKNPVVLHFTYNGSSKIIGNYCAYFNAVELREEIKNRKIA
ncbi:MAG TPA: hypothetical protein VN922_02950 [Bacteroidia bacterium]|nr:hypothetical protein [Bacteroidia bacterium]